MVSGKTSGSMMNVVVSIESDPSRKREIHRHLTALLPQWFGQPDSNLRYAEQAEVLTGYVARVEDEARGMLLLKAHSRHSIEVYWLGVDPNWHRAGIGRALVEATCKAAQADGVKFLFVSTLHPRETYEPYQRTRHFYEAMGFQYVLEEQAPKEGNPLAYYMKQLA